MAADPDPSLRYPDVATGTLLDRFLSGARIVASGVSFTLKRPAVLKWALIPMAIQTALFIAIVGYGFTQLDALVDRLGPEPGHWYSFIGALLFVGLAVALVLMGLLLTLLLGSVVCDPFYDLISEAVEEAHIGRNAGPPFSFARVIPGILRELVATVFRLALYLAVAMPLWIIGLTGVGSILAAPAGLAWTWAFVALEGISRSQARHAVAARQRFSTVAREPAVALGFGALGWLLAFIPLTAPLLVVGGTRLFLALAAWDRVPSALTDAEKTGLRA